MLGLQNTRTGDDLPTRTYRCVACAATFSGLSSLLVHQASHANDGNPLDKLQPTLSSSGISCTQCSIVFANKELMDQHCCGALLSSSSSFKCVECGEQFQCHDVLLDHKRLHHSSDLQVQDCSVGEENKCETKGTVSSALDQTNPSSSQGFSPVSGSDSGPTEHSLFRLLTGTATAPENERREDFSVTTTPLSRLTKDPLVPGQLMTAPVSQPVLFSALPAFTSPQDKPLLLGGKAMRPFLSSNVSTYRRILPKPHANDENPLNKPHHGCFMCWDCGEQFQCHDVLLDHKRLHHSSDLQVQDCSVEEENKCETKGIVSSPLDQTNPSSCQEPVCGSDSGPTELPLIPLLTGTATAPENVRREDFSVPTTPLSCFTKNKPIPAFTSPQDQPLLFGGKAMRPFLSSNVSTCRSILPKPQDLQQPKKTLKKRLVSEVVKRLPPARMSWNHTKRNTFSKNTASTVAGVEASPAYPSGTTVRQLLLAKSAAKRKAHSQASAILNLITSNKPHNKVENYVVNLNMTFLPVVALVTRQKLLGGGKDGMEGRHQCGRCRKIFKDVDSLILHHAMHRKERVNGCRQCGHLLIGKIAIPRNHLCPQTSMLSPQDIFSVGILLSSPSGTHAHTNILSSVVANPLNMTPFPSAKKNYHCFLCNQSYTRLYSLKMHKCLGTATFRKAAASHKKDGVQSPAMGMRVDRELKTIEKQNEVVGDDLPLVHKSVGVEPAGELGIKLEAFDVRSLTGVMSPQCLEAECPHLGVNPGSPKMFMPYLRNSAKHAPSKNLPSQMEGSCDFPAQGFPPVFQGNLKENKRDDKMASGSAEIEKGKGQWTMPIDDPEIDQIMEAEGTDDDDNDNDNEEEVMESIIEKSIDTTQNPNSSQNLAFQGVGKCFTCCHCRRSYTRRFTLHQHQKKCPLGVRPAMQQNMRKTLKFRQAWAGKQRFDCLQCGRSFSNRDTLVLHQRNCQLRNNRGDGHGDLSGPKKRSSMPLRQNRLASQGRLFVLPPAPKTKGSKKPAASGDWGIMSLPSVLPRKVTCECGEGFTCPRLLFEHLQSHAQESYTCPDCGKILTSRPAFDAHLRKHQPITCQKCNQTFTLHKSLQRHLNKNRCTGNAAAEKKHCCPRCKLELPSSLGLKRHMQSPACKPSHKLIRCPVCMRAFGGVEGLQKHLIAHTHPNAFHCQLCQRSYPSLRSLKDHQRKVHRRKEKSSGPMHTNQQ